MRASFTCLIIVACANAPSYAQNSAIPTPAAPIALEQARRVVAEAEKQADDLRAPSTIAVVDAAGDLVFFEQMDGARPAGIELAIGKARSAARFRMATEALQKRLESGHVALVTAPVTALPGGMPIIVGGKIIGALGVSGLEGTIDVQIASKAVASASH